MNIFSNSYYSRFEIGGKIWNTVDDFISYNFKIEDADNKAIILGIFAKFCQNKELKNKILTTDDSLLNKNLLKVKKCIKLFDKKYDLEIISNFPPEIFDDVLFRNKNIPISKQDDKQKYILNAEDILVFEYCKNKGDNDKNNKIRENVLLNINEPTYLSFTKDTRYGNMWLNIKNKWNIFLKELYISDKYNSIVIKKKGGRNSKYDFEIEYMNGKEVINTVRLEFKFNSKSIEALPQFLNLPESADILGGNSYGKFFYSKYLSKITALNPSEFTNINISLTEYLKVLYQNNYDKHSLFVKLKELEETNEIFKQQKKILVDESINEFLKKFSTSINLPKILDIIKNTQENKLFVLWDCTSKKFILDTIEVKNNILYCGIKNKNTIVIKIGNNHNDYYDLLLRWKNHKGILYPAWQIKKTTDNKKLCI